MEDEQQQYEEYVKQLSEVADQMTLAQLKEHVSFMNQWAARLYKRERANGR